MRDKLIEIMKYRRHLETSELADVLLANGVIVLPCKIGDKVWATIGLIVIVFFVKNN